MGDNVHNEKRGKPVPGPGASFGRADYVSAALLALLCVLVIAIVCDYGISNDEEVQHSYGELILNYYSRGFAARSLFAYKNLYLYGGLFDIVAALLAKVWPFDLYLLRHGLSAAIGIAGLAATAATARLVACPRAGLIALVLLAICGPYFGGMFNHTKDVPFAAAMMGAIYFLMRAARDWPRPQWRHVIAFGLLLGAATGLRTLGLLLVGYAGLLLLVSAALPSLRPQGMPSLRFFAEASLRMLPAFILGYAIMLIAWPWAAQAPLNPLRALFTFAHFHYEIRTIVAGEVFTMADVPWWYVPFYIAIKTPPVVFAGVAAALILAFVTRRNPSAPALSRKPFEIGILAFVAVFPVLCEALTEGPAFTGMRHFLFVLPPLAALAGTGFDQLLLLLSSRRLLEYAAAATLCAIVVWNAVTLVRLHPYQYMYYNAAVGGLEGAARRYEMDYWVNMMPDAVQALQDHLGLPRDASQRVYTVGVCGEKFAFDHYADKRLKASPGWLEADFYIAPTHMNCDRLVDGRVIATISRLGVPIGVVKDRRGITQKTLGRAF